MKKLSFLLLLLLAGCQTGPRMVVITKAESWQHRDSKTQTVFQSGEDIVIKLDGCEEKSVQVIIVEHNTQKIVLKKSGVPKKAVKLPTVDTIMVRTDTGVHPMHRTTFYHHSNGLDVTLDDPGVYDAELTVDGKLLQTRVFTILPKAVP